ncbi:MAG: thiamine-phosphate kinase [Magnetococcales bacterium]|nr:thiamine-phosphate kinase [Magnetococcales bacterium]
MVSFQGTSPVETIATVGEFQLIQRLFTSQAGGLPPGVAVGIGDDAAVVSVPRTQQLVVTTDTLVEGIHFTADADPFLLGQKALRINLSDLAAMAAQPHWYLLSLSLPSQTPVAWVEALVAGLRLAAQRPAGEVVLLGGNTTGSAPGGISITITLLGLIGTNRAVTRSGAQVGDRILVTGTIGDATLGWASQRGALPGATAEDLAALQQRHRLPDPPVELAIALQEAAYTRSAVDISDGLLADLGHLCQASQVGARLEAERVPLSPAARRQVERHGVALLAQMLSGGEDYELLFTVSPTAVAGVQVLAEAAGVRVTEIGVITAGVGVTVTCAGQPLPVASGGWDHFGSA